MSDVREVVVRLQAMSERARDEGARVAAQAMGNLFVREVATNELRRYSHPPGTPTPSPPGEPPALVTGTLRRSVHATAPRQTGPGRWEVEAGGSVVYARIQELGGVTGRGHRTRLPARPYLRPAARRLSASGRLTEAATQAFERAVYE